MAAQEQESGLDRDRVASMADEGGAAAAEVEAQAAAGRSSRRPSRPGAAGILFVAGFALAGVLLALMARRRRGEPGEGAG